MIQVENEADDEAFPKLKIDSRKSCHFAQGCICLTGGFSGLLPNFALGLAPARLEPAKQGVPDNPDDPQPQAQPKSDDGKEEKDQDDEEYEATSTDIASMAFLPFAKEGEVTGIGFVESGGDDACTWNEIHHCV